MRSFKPGNYFTYPRYHWRGAGQSGSRASLNR
jgi:hypothetical protein